MLYIDSMSSKMENTSPVLLRQKPVKREKKLKYHVFFFIITLLLFLFLFLLLRMGPDILPFAMFILFFSFPLLVLFGHHLKDVVPSRLAKLLTEDVEVVKGKRDSSFLSTKGRLTNRNKQYILILFLMIISVSIIQLIRTLYKEIDPLSAIPSSRKTTLKLMMTLSLTIFACVITLNFYEISENYYKNKP